MMGSGESPLSGLQTAAVSLYPHMEGQSERQSPPPHVALVHRGSPALMNSPTSKGPISKYHHTGSWGFNVYELGRGTYSI